MIHANDIIRAINELLLKKWPERLVFKGSVPKDFCRPSFLIEAVRHSVRRSNPNLCKISAYFTLTAFVDLDEYGKQDPDEVLKAQIEILELFQSGTLAVCDRVIKLCATGGGHNEGEAYIDIQTEYYVSLPKNDSTMLMGGVKTKINTEG